MNNQLCLFLASYVLSHEPPEKAKLKTKIEKKKKEKITKSRKFS